MDRRGRARWALIGACLLATGVLAPPVAAQPAARAATDPVRIMLVGDSMTEGSSGDWTWRYRLDAYLDAAGVDHELVGPRSTLYDPLAQAHTSVDYADPDFDRDHFARWGQSLRLVLDENAPAPEDGIGWAVDAYQPDVVVELLGVNDLLYGATPAEALELTHQLVQDVRDARPDTALVLSTVPAGQYPSVAEFNALLTATAPAWGTDTSPVVVADPAPGWTPAVDTCDHTHPSAVGEVKIAAAQADALATWGIGVPAPRPLPEPPVGPRLPATLAVVPGDGEASLTWQLPPGGTSVLVSVRDVTADEPWQQLPVPLEGSSWVAGGLQDGHTYAFRLNVLKHDCVAADVDSDEVSVTPQVGAPGFVTGLAAAPLEHGLAASWAPTPTATSYVVWVRPSDRTDGWQTSEAATTSLEVTGLEAGRSYDVALQAVGPGGAGPVGDPVPVVPTGVAPVSPVGVAANATADGSVTLTWLPAEHATSYRLQHRAARPGAPWVSDAVPPGATAAVVGDLRGGRRYLFRVRGDDGLVPGAWSGRLGVDVPVVGPVRDVVAHLRDGGRVLHARGSAVRWATAYRLLVAAAPGCRDEPADGRFDRVGTALAGPRLGVAVRRAPGALWVRWRAEHDGVPGRVGGSSTVCVRR